MRRSAIFLSIIPLLACVQPGQKPAVVTEAPPPAASAELPPIVLPQRITAVGLGAMPHGEGLSPEQRRIMAMRASKLDAYRALAEIVDGLKLTGSSTVSAVALTNDSFRVYIESYLRGARVLSTMPLPGGSYETVVELQLGSDFYRDASTASRGVAVNAASAAPAAHVVVKPTEAPVASAPSSAPTASAPSSNFYLAK
jgi:outer membrane protein FlgP